jgi:hypothetical protein
MSLEYYTIIDQATGEIKGGGATEFAQATPLQAGEAMYWGEMLDRRTHYFVDGQPVAYTEEQRQAKDTRPTYYAKWSNATMSWVDQRSLEEAKADKQREIERVRDAMIVSPVIVYDGINLDADARSVENLKSKLLEVGSRIAVNDPLPPEQLMWKDADNELHFFADMATYKTWLDGFAILLGSRGTAAYGWSWYMKAQLEACTTIEEVKALQVQ